ncbi:Tim44/TimA family putative adaptor protein [Allosphingosinicella flava]|uniref:Tim44/TimA family putative adaptor protein n=1 Tax=Allosphingosinicella flava TaxID=2771430 RepID=UPI001CF7D60E|nr:Tim44/TimA family putative adaptor protein [Sphingosinicella flava]
MTVEIVLLAMVAVFAGLRLYAVLGRRTGHEQQPVLRPKTMASVDTPAPVQDLPAERFETNGLAYEKSAETGIRALIAADPSFDVARFLEGAQSAYRMILEAFWTGNRAELDELVDGEAQQAFEEAIAAREAEGLTLNNRLIAIDKAVIESVELSGRTAFVSVRFDADIAAVTRDRDGNVVAGSLSDAIETHDIWTFQRDLGSADPNWMLVETDAVA